MRSELLTFQEYTLVQPYIYMYSGDRVVVVDDGFSPPIWKLQMVSRSIVRFWFCFVFVFVCVCFLLCLFLWVFFLRFFFIIIIELFLKEKVQDKFLIHCKISIVFIFTYQSIIFKGLVVDLPRLIICTFSIFGRCHIYLLMYFFSYFKHRVRCISFHCFAFSHCILLYIDVKWWFPNPQMLNSNFKSIWCHLVWFISQNSNQWKFPEIYFIFKNFSCID